MSIYFDLLYRYRFLASIITPQLSVLILIVFRSFPIYSGNPISRRTCIIYYPCLQYIDILIYSNSQLKVNTKRYFLLLYITGLLKSIVICSEILLQSFIFTQLVLEYNTSILGSQILRHAFFISLNLPLKGLKYIFYLIIDLKYRLISFTTLYTSLIGPGATS